MKFAHFRTIIVGFYNTVDLFGGSHDIGQRSVMVHKVDQGSNELADRKSTRLNSSHPSSSRMPSSA